MIKRYLSNCLFDKVETEPEQGLCTGRDDEALFRGMCFAALERVRIGTEAVGVIRGL